jgi:hypothetical protein
MAENNIVVGVRNPYAETEAIIRAPEVGVRQQTVYRGQRLSHLATCRQATDLCRESAAAGWRPEVKTKISWR